MISLALLSGCVSATVDTPQGLVGTSVLPTATEVLTLENTSGIPTPTPRPGTTLVAAAPVEAEATPTPVATPPAPVVATIPDAPVQTDVNSRIASAVQAPVAGNEDVSEDVATLAEQPTPVAPPPQILASANEPKASSAASSGGFLNSLFGKNTNRKSPPAAVKASAAVKAPAEPPRVIATASASGSASALPGVDRERALGLRAADAIIEPIQVASAAGLARLTPNGLKTQHSGVDVKCLKPSLVRVLKKIEKRYGKPVIVTSGYRSAKRNASIRGAKNSLHIYCSAADIQVAGIDKWTLAKYLRSMPGRGGVGTYCHTKSVHIDIGPKRDWNWRCRRR
jgi:uncharacterized protein YcbK (DUF882 family)